MKKLFLICFILCGLYVQAHAQLNGTGTYSPAYYRNQELKQRGTDYTRLVNAMLAYEVKNMKKFIDANIKSNRKGFGYVLTNSALAAELMQGEFAILFKDSNGRELGSYNIQVANLQPGKSSGEINVQYTLPAGTASFGVKAIHIVAE